MELWSNVSVKWRVTGDNRSVTEEEWSLSDGYQNVLPAAPGDWTTIITMPLPWWQAAWRIASYKLLFSTKSLSSDAVSIIMSSAQWLYLEWRPCPASDIKDYAYFASVSFFSFSVSSFRLYSIFFIVCISSFHSSFPSLFLFYVFLYSFLSFSFPLRNRRNPEYYHYRIHKKQALTPILRLMDPIHMLPSYFLKIHFNIILPLRPGVPSDLPLQISLQKLSPRLVSKCLSHPFWFEHHNNIWGGAQIIKLLVMRFSPSTHKDPDIVLRPLFLNTVRLCSSFNVRGQFYTNTKNR
jgi:hypothetical protein